MAILSERASVGTTPTQVAGVRVRKGAEYGCFCESEGNSFHLAQFVQNLFMRYCDR